eukprot:TRINITY_DN2219_c0_g1_i2.p1 TRINITY_DN2219_c0_g1~~TRINITY_DN2219_c0_g1_i2.p1  ORF type:complete len:317 (+),score=40.64 TRINITY_DN2219_c0_g1_i2:166-1116(+)
MACLAPLDGDGFVKSFPVAEDNAPEVRSFFNEFGFVVISRVLTAEECDATFEEFWDWRERDGLLRSNPATWEPYWKNQRFGRLGIMGNFSDIHSLRQLSNRQNDQVHEAFARVLGTHKLWVDHDRLGVMRPTVDIDLHDGDGPRIMESWRTLSNWLHLDCNPTEGFASIGSFADSGSKIDFGKTLIIQGLLTLTDATVVDGGFHCVPGSHNISTDWAANNQLHGTRNNMQVPQGDRLHEFVQQIPIRKGCLLVWNSLLFHGNHPNSSERFRAVQYIRCMPTQGTPYSPLVSDATMFPEEFKMSERGMKLFGISAWP